MTGKVVLEYSTPEVEIKNAIVNGTEPFVAYTATQVATAVSFMVGIFQVGIFLSKGYSFFC